MKQALTILISLMVLAFSSGALGQARERDTASEPDYSELLAINTNSFTTPLVNSSLGVAMQPANLLRTVADEPYLLWVELKRGLLHLLKREQNGGFQTLETHPISMGKEGYGKEIEGDQRTPVGIYTITSFLPDEDLLDKYGSGAFPLDYPNLVDKLESRTGYGIWLHGLPKGVTSRPRFDSDGCVVIDNSTLISLSDHIDIGSTRMILAETLDWVSIGANRPVRDRLESRLENWRSSWSAMDNDAYLAFYSTEFTNFSQSFSDWDAYKRRIHQEKFWIEVEVSDISLTSYPGDNDLVVAEFYQTYRSSNFNAQGLKKQLWRLEEDGVWRIVYEGGGG
jgi:murein L,D-transpeptidase YafK